MRIILKILLLPVTLALTIVVLFGRFICLFSGVLLNILAFVIFCIGVCTVILLGQPIWTGLRIVAIGWLFSSYGLPVLASFLVELVDSFNDRLKFI